MKQLRARPATLSLATIISTYMSRGLLISPAKVSAVLAFRRERLSPINIASGFRYSHSAVRLIVAKGECRVWARRCERSRLISHRTARIVVRKVKSNLLTACYAPEVSVRINQRVLRNAEHLGWRKILAASPLTPELCADRRVTAS